jgi:Fe-S cluster biogenesis protein NfuA
MAEAEAPSVPRLDDPAVQERLTRLDGLLEQLEQTPGPAGELALEAVSALAEVYGEALARAVAYAAESPAVARAMVGDELLGHLMVLHQVHPEPVEQRVTRALDGLRPAVQERGGEVELIGIEDDVAVVRISVSGCGSGGVQDAVREALLAVAPELADVRWAPADRAHTFVPLDALRTRPATSGVGP